MLLAALLVPLVLLAWPMVSIAITALAWVVSLVAVVRDRAPGCAVALGFVWVPVVGLSLVVYEWMIDLWPGIANRSELILWSLYGATGAAVFSLLSKFALLLFGSKEKD